MYMHIYVHIYTYTCICKHVYICYMYIYALYIRNFFCFYLVEDLRQDDMLPPLQQLNSAQWLGDPQDVAHCTMQRLHQPGGGQGDKQIALKQGELQQFCKRFTVSSTLVFCSE